MCVCDQNIIHNHNFTFISLYIFSHIPIKKNQVIPVSHPLSSHHRIPPNMQQYTRHLGCLPYFMTLLPDCPFCSEQGIWMTSVTSNFDFRVVYLYFLWAFNPIMEKV